MIIENLFLISDSDDYREVRDIERRRPDVVFVCDCRRGEVNVRRIRPQTFDLYLSPHPCTDWVCGSPLLLVADDVVAVPIAYKTGGPFRVNLYTLVPGRRPALINLKGVVARN